jgi:hypothetical protein
MKPDVDPFQVNTVGFEEKKILVRSDHASTTRGKNVIVSDELRNRMRKPQSPEVGVWKENRARKLMRSVKPTSNMLIDKYTRQQQQLACAQGWDREKGSRSPSYRYINAKQGVGFALMASGNSWTSNCQTGDMRLRDSHEGQPSMGKRAANTGNGQGKGEI